MVWENVLQSGEQEKQRLADIEASQPSFVDVGLASVRTAITGGNTFLDMVARKHVMPTNDGIDNYYDTQEFKDTVTQYNPDISPSDLEELKDSKNQDYLIAKINNQKNYRDAINTLDKAGWKGMVLEGAMGFADIPSWLGGGLIFKGGNVAYKALNMQRSAARMLYRMGQTGASAAGGIGLSEYLIQQEAGVNMQERLDTTVKYAAAFGVALPLLGTTFSSVATGNGRKALAQGATNILENIPGTGSLRGFFSLSSADQLIHQGTGRTAQEIGEKATTRTSAAKSADGNYITAADDTAMDYVDTEIEKAVTGMHFGILENSKVSKLDFTTQAFEDGKAWNDFTNGVEQSVRRDVAKMTPDDLLTTYRQETGIAELEIDKKIRAAQEAGVEPKVTFKDYPDDLYDVVYAAVKKKQFDNGRFVIPPQLQYVQDFYQKFGDDATQYGLKGIAGKDSRGYGHIKYNSDTILALHPDEARAMFKEMLLDDELNKAMIARGELKEADMDGIADKMVENALDRDFQNKYLDGGRGSQATSATKQRKLRMNRSLHPELFVNNIETIGLEYADRIGGKIALKKTYGLDTDQFGRITGTLKEVYKKIEMEGRANGASERAIKRDVENAKAVFETILGARKYNHNPDAAVQKTSRLLRKGSSVIYNAGFVKYALVEPTVAIMRYGLRPVIDNFVPSFKHIESQVRNSTPNAPMVKLLRQAGLAIQTQRGLKYSRYDNMEIVPTTGKAEMFLDKAAHIGRKYSGFNYVNDVSDAIAGGAALSELQNVMKRANNLTKAEASRLARYGLSSDDLALLNKQNIKFSKDGQVIDWNYDNWRNQDLAKRFVRYLGRATRDTITRADGTRVHRWQSDVNNPLAAMGLQFTQVPVALYERVLLNLGDEVSARTVVGMFISTAFMYSILKLEDIALTKAGVLEKETDDTRILIRAVTTSPYAGIIPNYIDFGLMLSKHAPLGSAFAPRTDLGSMLLGAGYSTGNKVLQTAAGLFDGVNGTDISNGLKLAPWINSYPGLKVLTKALEHDLKTEDKFKPTTPVNYDRPMYEYGGD